MPGHSSRNQTPITPYPHLLSHRNPVIKIDTNFVHISIDHIIKKVTEQVFTVLHTTAGGHQAESISRKIQLLKNSANLGNIIDKIKTVLKESHIDFEVPKDVSDKFQQRFKGKK